MQPSNGTQPSQLSIFESQPVQAPNSPIAYGLGSFGLDSLGTVFTGFYMFYYIDVLGLAVALAAIINVIYAVWDAVNDPLAGFLSDNTRTRWGRRRPWLLVGLPFYVGILVMVYAVPKPFLRGNALFWYALVIFFLFEAVYTIMWVNYSALFPELFQDFQERTHASPTYQGLSMLGELLGFSLPPIIYAKYGFVPMAMSFAVVAGITLLLGIMNSKEDPNALKAPPLDLKRAFGEVLKDRPYLSFTFAVTFLIFITSVYTLAIPFWMKYTLGGGPEGVSLIFAIVFIAAILSVSLWGRLVRALGIKRSWLWSIGLMAVSAIILGLASSLVLGAIGAAVGGVSMGGINVCREMIMSNFVNQSLIRTGQRREGVYYSLKRVLGKLSRLLVSLALVLLGLLFGYVSGENPGPHPENAFRFLISVFPLVATIIAWLISSKLSFENEQSSPYPG